MKKKYLFIIPARKNSQRIKNKNIKKINGKPLFYWTLKELSKLKKKYDIIISSNDFNIINTAKKMGFKVPFKRPNFLSTNNSKIIKTLKHILDFYQKKNIFYENFCLLQVTSPLRTKNDILKSIKIFEQTKSNTLISVFNLFKIYKKQLFFEKKKINFVSKIKKFPKNLYVMNGPAILITNTKNIKNMKLYGKKISFYEMPYHRSFDINVDYDFKICEKLLKYND